MVIIAAAAAYAYPMKASERATTASGGWEDGMGEREREGGRGSD